MTEHASVPPEQAERKRLADELWQVVSHAKRQLAQYSGGMEPDEYERVWALIHDTAQSSREALLRAIAAALDAPRHTLGREPSEAAIKAAMQVAWGKSPLPPVESRPNFKAVITAELRAAYAIDGALDAPRALGTEPSEAQERDRLWCAALGVLTTDHAARVLARFNATRPDPAGPRHYVCSHCGTSWTADTVTCPKCGYWGINTGLDGALDAAPPTKESVTWAWHYDRGDGRAACGSTTGTVRTVLTDSTCPRCLDVMEHEYNQALGVRDAAPPKEGG